MRLLHRDPAEEGLGDIERGVREFGDALAVEDRRLRDMFVSLKTDLLDEFLSPSGGRIKEQHIRILREQVRHVIGVARAVGYSALIRSFEEEERILAAVQDIVEQYPSVSLATSPDLRASLERLRSMLQAQQRMIFSHEEILLQEKQRLVAILGQLEQLRVNREAEHELERRSFPASPRPEFS